MLFYVIKMMHGYGRKKEKIKMNKIFNLDKIST